MLSNSDTMSKTSFASIEAINSRLRHDSRRLELRCRATDNRSHDGSIVGRMKLHPVEQARGRGHVPSRCRHVVYLRMKWSRVDRNGVQVKSTETRFYPLPSCCIPDNPRFTRQTEVGW